MSSASPKAAAPLAFRASIAALVLAIAGLVALSLWGFGDLDAGYAVQPPSFAVAYAALFTAALVAGAVALRLRRQLRGRDAAKDGKAPSRGPVFAVFAVLTVLEAAPVGYGLLRARNALSDDRMFAAAVAPPPGDPSVRSRLARYFEKGQRHRDEVSTRFIDELGGDREKIRQAAAEGGPLAGLAADALFTMTKDDPEALSWYLGRGGPRAAEADDALFEIARRQNTIGAYNTYLEHGTRHADVVRRDLLPDADYALALKVGVVGALCAYVRRNPESKHTDEARQRIHAMYAAGREKARERKVPPETERFRAALLDALEKRTDPRVTVLVTAALAKSVTEADEEYAKKYGAHYLRAASHFSTQAMEELGRNVREAVANELARDYPGGLIEVTDELGGEAQPIIGIDLTPVAYAAQTWGSPDDKTGDPDIVTPLVGFLVEVQATLHGTGGTPHGWRLKIEDDTEGKMEVAEDQAARSPDHMLDAAFASFFEDVPKRIAASFAEQL